ncbi:heterokaryon incompatibility protein-domain-containing protein [Fusarium redolens]|uniref:Heterokaryon incompatibility protein-domain-containing protein n=1 Tax=Fusarium redolens TaxID=48865 RepID=A0A9P9G0A1_FUSRE|nr:heterokaryon incompatibility protein-domain-containing protein [Fusarium redolens]KAH7228467.1 heterokaryon incompatibility protein-domain-containing protein [Fusarium redolens]
MDSPRLYHKLPFPDSIRLLELSQNETKYSICGHLVLSRLEDTPCFAALSYVWGCASSEDPILQVDGFELKIRQSLKHAIDAIFSGSDKILLWIDQICIDQENYIERQFQVTLMSKIFRQAQRVICWLGPDDENTKIAFDLSTVLAIEGSDLASGKEPMQRLVEAGFIHDISDLVNPAKVPLSALAWLVKNTWFGRLWIVQEVALASQLEFRCGGSTINGDIFFAAIRRVSSSVHNPPAPLVLEPFRHAVRLGQLRAQIADAISCSYPHLAHTFSTWDCTKNEDRLNALFGLAFPYNSDSTWFQPRYDLTGPELYIKFAKDYIKETGNLDILHFSGCGDSEKYSLYYIGGIPVLEPSPPVDDVPSWVPDWRVQSRPLVLLSDPGYDVRSHFTATLSKVDYFFDENEHKLHVRALLVDEIVACGYPYYLSLCRNLQITEHGIFEQWHELAKDRLNSDTFENMFSSTLVMDARMMLTERGALNVNQDEIPTLFKYWQKMMRNDSLSYDPDEALPVIEGSARYGYVAEEVCRNRAMFITKRGRLGLGSTHVSPGAHIYLLHGLKTPFVVFKTSQGHILRGECYVNGLMDQQVHTSESDIYIDLI